MTDRFLCNLPWDHLSVFPHSTCSVCCEAKHTDGAPGHAITKINGKDIELSVKTDKIYDIVNSDNYKAIRKDMLSGKVPEACQGCYKTEQTGGVSKRVRDSWRDIDYDNITSPDGTITPDLHSIELRLGNYCNLKCRGCNAESSTSWIADYRKLKDIVDLPSGYDALIASDTTHYDWVDDPKFYDQIIEHAPNLKNIFISGGEPFLVPKHFYLLERLIAEKKTHIGIGYHTNLNYDIEKLRKSLDLLTKFDKVTLNLSIDDVGERNTYIRSQSNWKLTIKNLKILYNEYDFNFTITQTFNAYNFLYAEELEQFLHTENINIPIFPNHIHAPEYLSPNVFQKEIRQHKLNSIKEKISSNLFDNLYGRYYNAPCNERYHEFKKFTTELDRVRKENVTDIFSRIVFDG